MFILKWLSGKTKGYKNSHLGCKGKESMCVSQLKIIYTK